MLSFPTSQREMRLISLCSIELLISALQLKTEEDERKYFPQKFSWLPEATKSENKHAGEVQTAKNNEPSQLTRAPPVHFCGSSRDSMTAEEFLNQPKSEKDSDGITTEEYLYPSQKPVQPKAPRPPHHPFGRNVDQITTEEFLYPSQLYGKDLKSAPASIPNEKFNFRPPSTKDDYHASNTRDYSEFATLDTPTLGYGMPVPEEDTQPDEIEWTVMLDGGIMPIEKRSARVDQQLPMQKKRYTTADEYQLGTADTPFLGLATTSSKSTAEPKFIPMIDGGVLPVPNPSNEQLGTADTPFLGLATTSSTSRPKEPKFIPMLDGGVLPAPAPYWPDEKKDTTGFCGTDWQPVMRRGQIMCVPNKYVNAFSGEYTFGDALIAMSESHEKVELPPAKDQIKQNREHARLLFYSFLYLSKVRWEQQTRTKEAILKNFANPVNFYCENILPRIAAAGTIISAATIHRTVPQIQRTSNGILPYSSNAQLNRIMLSQIVKQSLIKTMQFGMMRECKLHLQAKTNNDALSTMLAYGITGVPFQSIMYNIMIRDTYKHFGKAPPKLTLRNTIAPGILWCFLRESLATGGGLYLGGSLSPYLQQMMEKDYDPQRKPSFSTRFGTGLVCGATTALMTQWLHNTCLTAGRLATLGEPTQSPHYTLVSLQKTYEELGKRMFRKRI